MASPNPVPPVALDRAGLSADRWPPAPAPNPLLPFAWQRERNVPRSSAKRELAFAETLTDTLAWFREHGYL